MNTPDSLRVGVLERQIAEQAARLQILEKTLGLLTAGAVLDQVSLHIFDGGRAPVRQTDGAIGFDAWSRAIVDPLSKPTQRQPLRTCLADFMRAPGWQERMSPALVDSVVDDPEGHPDRYAITLPPGERLMVGLGFATAMPFPMYYWVAPRSGLASRGITIANSPGTVDPDYRGEAGALVENNSRKDFVISYGMRIAQIVFGIAVMPNLQAVGEHNQLGHTPRSAGGFGSTGLTGGKTV